MSVWALADNIDGALAGLARRREDGDGRVLGGLPSHAVCVEQAVFLTREQRGRSYSPASGNRVDLSMESTYAVRNRKP